MVGLAKAAKKAIYTYKARKFVIGFEIQGTIEGVDPRAKYIAVPVKLFDRHAAVRVVVGDEYMYIYRNDKPLGFRRFIDKFGRDKYYTLAYYPWRGKKLNNSK